ncbi:AN1-type zinc finger protein 6 [Drosophila suzukii]|uniref:AN1-type zinc finger protein 6 n=1 Tax=Drosophila suzukii TaxID=28584 RepID=A0AB39ZIT2_DROSZ
MKTGKLCDSGEPKPDIILDHSEAGLHSDGQPLASESQLPVGPVDHRELQDPNDPGEPKPDIILDHSKAGRHSDGQPLAPGSQLPVGPVDHQEPQDSKDPQPVRAQGGQNSQSANSSDAGQSQNPGQNQDAGAGSGSGHNKNQNQQQQQSHNENNQNDQDKNQEQDAPKKRCDKCGKKLGLTGGFPCRCGGTYCAVHRYSDRHECSFDYREMGATEIRRNNPVVVASKLRKL